MPDIKLQILFASKIFWDFFWVPFCLFFEFVIRIFSKKERSGFLMVSSNDVDKFNFNDCVVVVHHFADLSDRFVKIFSGKEVDCGIEAVLNESVTDKFEVFCFVTECSSEYWNFLKEKYPRVTFSMTTKELYDFGSYIKSGLDGNLLNKKYVAFFNDNVSVKSQISNFIKNSIAVMNCDTSVAIVGSFYNTFLTQSFFKKRFSPHIQTFGFVTRVDVFSDFSRLNRWYPLAKPLKFFVKQAVCRLFEQGYSKYILKRSLKIAIRNEYGVFAYFRRFKWFEDRIAWRLGSGDSRMDSGEKFLFK